MNDLISRDAVLAYTEKQHKLNKVFESEDAYICFWEGINDREGELKAKDVPPVKRGHWIECYTDSHHYSGICSVCGKASIRNLNDKPYEYCPRCRADMRGENDE